MSVKQEIQDGATIPFQRIESPPQPHYKVDETQFDNWQYRWNSKEEVIDHLLGELEKSMSQSIVKTGVKIGVFPRD